MKMQNGIHRYVLLIENVFAYIVEFIPAYLFVFFIHKLYIILKDSCNFVDRLLGLMRVELVERDG